MHVEACETSLYRLGVERIDLYRFHWPDETGILLGGSWSAMVRLAGFHGGGHR